ncbi:leukotriene A-4 hydrolase [Phlebotomus argentipes]|uniref:leukotriene A-4 hydrolase n=1 Tax=Phlebotomus argentipes TaxID=94469 RepID=UPI0028930EEC|nr:leukotriene A-4 hydrolase [Phlebotomus argentipes]
MRLSKVDPSSFSNADEIVTTHVKLDWTVDFQRSVLSGSAEISMKITATQIDQIFLDVSDLKISGVSLVQPAGSFPVTFSVSDFTENIGSKLTIDLPTMTSGKVTLLVEYETSPKASGLLWLSKEQTLGKEHPYLFSQCQSIHARSLMPCQDTPAVKFPYSARVRHPEELVALMSAIQSDKQKGVTSFEQTVPIPSYLLAIVVGDLVSEDLSPITRVWAERDLVREAAQEFSETSVFLEKAVEICGPYVWKRYDLLVMPPSFPFGGMENPCLTFVTPTIIAGDKSLVSVVAHEISHSWTGNLVTNRNFEHFWLNEGFTVFVEDKIKGAINGEAFRDFYSLLGLSELKDCMNVQLKDKPEIQKLVPDLTELSPDDAFSTVPYMKGSTFLRYLENLFGGPSVFDPFLRFYLNKYKFQSIESNDFKSTVFEYFHENKYSEILAQIDWDKWFFSPGMPPEVPAYDTSLVDAAQKHAQLWKDSQDIHEIENSPLLQTPLSSLQIVEMLSKLLDQKVVFGSDKLTAFTKAYKFAETRNSEIRFRYLRMCILARNLDSLDDIFAFANSNFRMKFTRPLYKELSQWPEVRERAIESFHQHKDEMMRTCAVQVANDMGIAV